MNTVTGRIDRVDGALVAQLPGGRVPVPAELGRAIEAAGIDEVVIGVRPEDLRFTDSIGEGGAGIPASVSVVESLGHERHVICRLADQQLVIVRQDAHERAPAEESTTHLATDAAALHVFETEHGTRIGS
jgi:multiple sugar transport system ATP-binding protein